MPPRFIYFDLGNVLLRFSHEKMAQQGAELCGCPPELVMQAVFGNGMYVRVETGTISLEEFYESFCRVTQTQPDPVRLAWALNDIFGVVEETQPFLRFLAKNEIPRGILSNTGVSHWTHCVETFPFLLEFIPENHILSYEVGARKPDREIYEAAFETAKRVLPDLQPAEVLFIDDLERNVEGARQFGFDSFCLDDPQRLTQELAQRGF